MRRRRLRLAVAGCGAVFERHHLPALRRNREWELVAACDPVGDRRIWVRHATDGKLVVFESLAEMLAACHVDAVLIATPPDTHSALTVQALRASVHVLVEKPMSLNPVEAGAMVEAAVRAQRHLWVGFSRRFLQAYVDLRRLLASIRKDRIRSARFVFSSDVQTWKAISTSVGDDARGGGVVDDIVSHQLDLLPWMLGLEIQEISGEDHNPGDGRWVRCHLKFENGLVALCEAGHTDRYRETVTIELEDRTLVTHWRQGVRTVWHWPGAGPSLAGLAWLTRSAREAVWRRSNPIAESFGRQWTAFAAVVRGHKPRLTGADASSGLRNIQALSACHQSLRAGGRWTPVAREAGPSA